MCETQAPTGAEAHTVYFEGHYIVYDGNKRRGTVGEKRAYKSRKPGGGRKKSKPEFDAGKNLKEQMESAVALYDEYSGWFYISCPVIWKSLFRFAFVHTES